MITDFERKIILDAFEKEGTIDESGHYVVPADFFTRLNAALNPVREGPSIIERMVASLQSRDEKIEAAMNRGKHYDEQSDFYFSKNLVELGTKFGNLAIEAYQEAERLANEPLKDGES